ncbi:MAG: nitroreductase family deazaflavin-dependent oxidoreductase [Myxococcota bacterium]
MSPRTRRIAKKVIKHSSRANVWLYRKSGGQLGAGFFSETDVCLLTTIGRKSGLPRTVPLLYMPDGPRVVLVASKGGYPKHPLWYLNLKATPRVTLQIGAEERPMEARTATDDERAELWPRLVVYYPGYADYQAVTDRLIPVVILEPVE